MKLTRIALTAVLLLFILGGAVACTLLTAPQTEELETEIYTYLDEKYPDLEFEIKSYTQDTYTSGKYVFQVFCKTTEIDFQIYRSSFLTTDSYTVTYANLAMEKLFFSFFGEEFCESQISSVQWLDSYADDQAGYKFRDIDLSALPDSVMGAEGLYRITLRATDTESVFQSIKAITEKLSAAGVPCDKIAFAWMQNDYTIVFSTNTFTLNDASDEEMLAFLAYVSEAKQSDENVTVSYISRFKYATLLLDELADGKQIPGFEERFSEAEPTETTEMQ